MKKWVFSSVLFTTVFIFGLKPLFAVPLYYSFSGTVSGFEQSYAPGPFDHPEFVNGTTVEGRLTWDTDYIVQDDFISGRYAVLTQSTPFLEFSIDGVDFTIDYSYYITQTINNTDSDAFMMHNLGGQDYYYADQRYVIDAPGFSFYGAADLFSDNSYPDDLDFADFTSASLFIPTDYFYDLTAVSPDSPFGQGHSQYYSQFTVNVDRIESVPEPAVSLLLAASLVGCGVACRFRRRKPKRSIAALEA